MGAANAAAPCFRAAAKTRSISREVINGRARVVHGDELDLFLEGLQSSPDRILSARTATNYPADLSENSVFTIKCRHSVSGIA